MPAQPWKKMKNGSIFGFFRFLPFVLTVFFVSIFFCQEKTSAFLRQKTNPKHNPAPLLLDIFNEVKELGFYENENFLLREFQMNLDGNDNNKEEYVMVFSQNVDGIEKMMVQVTYFEPEKNNWIIKHAVETKEIKCTLKGNDVKIRSCDYSEKEVRNVLREILKGIRIEKELLKLIRKNGF
jgi:hypothetical protein